MILYHRNIFFSWKSQKRYKFTIVKIWKYAAIKSCAASLVLAYAPPMITYTTCYHKLRIHSCIEFQMFVCFNLSYVSNFGLKLKAKILCLSAWYLYTLFITRSPREDHWFKRWQPFLLFWLNTFYKLYLNLKYVRLKNKFKNNKSSISLKNMNYVRFYI